MNDDFPDFPIKVFLDSNIVLECLPLKDLPWKDIDIEGPILILLTPTLLKEVDSKKKDGRLGPKARKFNRMVASLVTASGPALVIDGKPEVHIGIARCSRIDWDAYDDLDPNEGDARITAEILNVVGVPAEQRLVVSQDINPLIMAQRHGLKSFHVSENWLPKPEPSPLEKEITKLKRTISEYQKVEPVFQVEFKGLTETPNVYQFHPLSDNESVELINDILKANPEPKQGTGSLSYLSYDSSLRERYGTYESTLVPAFVWEYHKKLELLFNQFPISLIFENKGNVRADHAVFEVQVVGGWINGKPVMVSLGGPKAPRARERLGMRIPNMYLDQNKSRNVGRHEVDVEGPKRSNLFSAQCEDFRQGQTWELQGVIWLDSHYERDSIVIVKVTAANLHGTATFNFPIKKTVTQENVSTVVDLSIRKSVIDAPILPLVSRLVKDKKYGEIEWDTIVKD